MIINTIIIIIIISVYVIVAIIHGISNDIIANELAN